MRMWRGRDAGRDPTVISRATGGMVVAVTVRVRMGMRMVMPVLGIRPLVPRVPAKLVSMTVRMPARIGGRRGLSPLPADVLPLRHLVVVLGAAPVRTGHEPARRLLV